LLVTWRFDIGRFLRIHARLDRRLAAALERFAKRPFIERAVAWRGRIEDRRFSRVIVRFPSRAERFRQRRTATLLALWFLL
jgi:hypothetical protein